MMIRTTGKKPQLTEKEKDILRSIKNKVLDKRWIKGEYFDEEYRDYGEEDEYIETFCLVGFINSETNQNNYAYEY